MEQDPAERGPRLEVVLVSRCFVKGKDGRILLIKRSSSDSHNPNKWEAPGGKLEQGEDVTQTLENEVMEETRLVVKPVHPLAFISSHVIGNEGKYFGFTYVVIFSITEVVGNTQVVLSDEHAEHEWVPYEKLFEYDLTPETRKAAAHLERYLAT